MFLSPLSSRAYAVLYIYYDDIYIVVLNLGAQGRPDAASDDVYEILIISILRFDSFLRPILYVYMLYNLCISNNIMTLKPSVVVYTRVLMTMRIVMLIVKVKSCRHLRWLKKKSSHVLL